MPSGKKEREWAKTAVEVQDASNLSGVVREWGRILGEMVEEGVYHAWRDHPVNRLFVDKLLDMMGRDHTCEKFWVAWRQVQEVLKETEGCGV